MNFSKCTAFFLTISLSGCINTTHVPVPESAVARPGEDLIPPSFAGNFFTEICLTTAPDFQNVPQAISGEPFIRHSETGTYYHRFSDLSIKVAGYGCSLVFKSELSIDETISELANGVAMNAENWGVQIPRNLDITSNPSPDGKGRYYRIGLPR
jgi:hypothetical protein